MSLNNKLLTMTKYKKSIFYGTAWRIILAVLALAYGIAVIINYCKERRVKPELITVILISVICAILVTTGIMSLICYFIKLKGIRNSCEYSSFEESVEENGIFIEGCHFFMPDFFLTLEIPAKIYYKDISEIKFRNLSRSSMLCIRTKNNKKYYIRRLYKYPIWESYTERKKNLESMLSNFNTKNPNIKFSRYYLWDAN